MTNSLCEPFLPMIARRIRTRASAAAILLAVSIAAGAMAQPGDFYDQQLRAGKEAFAARRYAEACEEFRIANFGFLERPQMLLEGLARLAVAESQLHNESDAGAALDRFLSVEQQFGAFDGARLEPALRGEFERLLSARRPQAAAAITSLRRTAQQPAPEPHPAAGPLPRPAEPAGPPAADSVAQSPRSSPPVSPSLQPLPRGDANAVRTPSGAPNAVPATAPVTSSAAVAPPSSGGTAPAAPPRSAAAAPPKRQTSPVPAGPVTSAPAAAAPQPAADPERAEYERMARKYRSTTPRKTYVVRLNLVCAVWALKTDIQIGGPDFWFVPTAFRQRPCFTTLWGRYSNPEDATRGAAGIPEKLSAGVRLSVVSLGSIPAEIR